MLNNRRIASILLQAAVITLLLVPAALARPVPASFADLAEKLSPTVVNVYTTQVIKTPPWQNELFENELFRRFFGFPQVPRRHPQELKRTSLGSGVILSPDGYIVTNNHVVEDADEISVKIANHDEYPATIVGRDPKTDIALIKIEPKDPLPAAEFGDSDSLRVGDWVIAIGNPFGFEHTVTAGIVSAKGRYLGSSTYENFIQTDASINPGNSGGPLFDMHGRMVGINTAIYSRSGGNVGLGFAIPANMVRTVVEQLKETGTVSRGWLGVMIQHVTPELADQFGLDHPMGALVGEVTPDSPADKGGLEPGDVIVKFGDKVIEQMNMLPAIVAQTPVGTKVKIEVIRDGERRRLTVTIGKLDEESGGVAGGRIKKRLGLTVQEITPELAESMNLEAREGLIVTDVDPDSAAAAAGLRRGDIILEVGRRPVKDVEAFTEAVRESGGALLLLVERDGHTRYVVIKRKKR